MKKKVLFILIICCLAIIFGYLFFNKKESSISKYNDISFLIFDNETKDYKKVNEIPEGNFVVNKTKSYCVNGGEVYNYDNVTKRVTYRLSGADSCYVYLDYENVTLGYNIKNNAILNTKITDKITNEIINEEKYGIRYEGDNVNNYVCFNESCKENELYRIIGLFNIAGTNYIKLIKATPLEDLYEYNTNTKVFNKNDFANSSTLNYLNTEYYESLGFKSLIEETNYRISGLSTNAINAYEIYDEEALNKTYDGSTALVGKKIGLMYASDYAFASIGNVCHETKLSEFDNCFKTNWLYLNNLEYYNNNEWITNSYIKDNISAFTINVSGNLEYGSNNVENDKNLIRPSFYVSEKLIISSGNGSLDTPYILK